MLEELQIKGDKIKIINNYKDTLSNLEALHANETDLSKKSIEILLAKIYIFM